MMFLSAWLDLFTIHSVATQKIAFPLFSRDFPPDFPHVLKCTLPPFALQKLTGFVKQFIIDLFFIYLFIYLFILFSLMRVYVW